MFRIGGRIQTPRHYCWNNPALLGSRLVTDATRDVCVWICTWPARCRKPLMLIMYGIIITTKEMSSAKHLLYTLKSCYLHRTWEMLVGIFRLAMWSPSLIWYCVVDLHSLIINYHQSVSYCHRHPILFSSSWQLCSHAACPQQRETSSNNTSPSNKVRLQTKSKTWPT